MFSAHTDVVPPGDLSLWDGDPFVPRLVDGSIHGRGACDMKGGLVAALAALAAVRSAGVRLVRPVALHGVVGEEDGGLGAWATIRRGHLGDLCVIPEPTARRRRHRERRRPDLSPRGRPAAPRTRPCGTAA